MRILMVCLGNICRSPIAEGVMRHKIKEHGLGWTVESAGTESYHIGEAPHRLSQKECLKHGIDISDQRAKKFTKADLTAYDHVYAMATDVYKEIEAIGGRHADMSRVGLFLDELPSAGLGMTARGQSVPDPYYGTEDGYKIVYDMIDKTCDAIVSKYGR